MIDVLLGVDRFKLTGNEVQQIDRMKTVANQLEMLASDEQTQRVINDLRRAAYLLEAKALLRECGERERGWFLYTLTNQKIKNIVE